MDNWVLAVIGLAQTIGVGLFGYLLKNSVPKYLEKKAENQATKEDIEGITKVVENIKSELTAQNERLKAELSIKNQHALNLKAAEREAIFDYNRKFYTWMYSLSIFSSNSYSFKKFEQIRIKQTSLINMKYECDLAKAHLLFFIYSDDLVDIISKMTELTLMLHTLTHNYINYFTGSHVLHTEIYNAENDETNKKTALEKFLKKMSARTDDHVVKRDEYFNKCLDCYMELKPLLIQRLKELEQELN